MDRTIDKSLNVSNAEFLGLPLPEIEELELQESGRDDKSLPQRETLGSSSGQDDKTSNANEDQSADPECKWCLEKNDGTKCILCELNDAITVSNKKRKAEQAATKQAQL